MMLKLPILRCTVTLVKPKISIATSDNGRQLVRGAFIQGLVDASKGVVVDPRFQRELSVREAYDRGMFTSLSSQTEYSLNRYMDNRMFEPSSGLFTHPNAQKQMTLRSTSQVQLRGFCSSTSPIEKRVAEIEGILPQMEEKIAEFRQKIADQGAQFGQKIADQGAQFGQKMSEFGDILISEKISAHFHRLRRDNTESSWKTERYILGVSAALAIYFGSNLRTDINEVKAETAKALGDFKAEMSTVKSDFKAEMSTVKSDFKAEISTVKSDLMAVKMDLHEVKAKVDVVLVAIQQMGQNNLSPFVLCGSFTHHSNVLLLYK